MELNCADMFGRLEFDPLPQIDSFKLISSRRYKYLLSRMTAHLVLYCLRIDLQLAKIKSVNITKP